MKAVLVDNKKLEIQEIETVKIKENEVLLKIRASGNSTYYFRDYIGRQYNIRDLYVLPDNISFEIAESSEPLACVLNSLDNGKIELVLYVHLKRP